MTAFFGYDRLDTESEVLAIIRDGQSVKSALAGAEVEVFFGGTTFYGESGGQIGDTGAASTETGTMRIGDTRLPWRVCTGTGGRSRQAPCRSDSVRCFRSTPDAAKRIRKSHTGTHILHSALAKLSVRTSSRQGLWSSPVDSASTSPTSQRWTTSRFSRSNSWRTSASSPTLR